MLGQKKYAEAEPELLAAYDVMAKIAVNASDDHRARVKYTAIRIAKLYRDWGKEELAKEWAASLIPGNGPSGRSGRPRPPGKPLFFLRLFVATAHGRVHAKIPHGTGQTILREAFLIADHNAYHIGQLVLLRRLAGAWKGD